MTQELLPLIGMALAALVVGGAVLTLRRERNLQQYHREILGYESNTMQPHPRTPADRRSPEPKQGPRRPRRLGRVALISIIGGMAAALLDLFAHFPSPGHRIMVQAVGGAVVIVGAVLLAIAYSDQLD